MGAKRCKSLASPQIYGNVRGPCGGSYRNNRAGSDERKSGCRPECEFDVQWNCGTAIEFQHHQFDHRSLYKCMRIHALRSKPQFDCKRLLRHGCELCGYCNAGVDRYLHDLSQPISDRNRERRDLYQQCSGRDDSDDFDRGGCSYSPSTVAGQDVRLSYSATAGQRIVLYATSVTNQYASLILVTPSGGYQAFDDHRQQPIRVDVFHRHTDTCYDGHVSVFSVLLSGAYFGS